MSIPPFGLEVTVSDMVPQRANLRKPRPSAVHQSSLPQRRANVVADRVDCPRQPEPASAAARPDGPRRRVRFDTIRGRPNTTRAKAMGGKSRPPPRPTPASLPPALAWLRATELLGLHSLFGAFCSAGSAGVGVAVCGSGVVVWLAGVGGRLLLPVFFVVAGFRLGLTGIGAAGVGRARRGPRRRGRRRGRWHGRVAGARRPARCWWPASGSPRAAPADAAAGAFAVFAGFRRAAAWL
jgi:hypothetical protein